jgi:hypothetical protein
MSFKENSLYIKTNKWHIKLSNRTLNPKLGIRYLIFAIGFLNVQPTYVPFCRYSHSCLLRFHHRPSSDSITVPWLALPLLRGNATAARQSSSLSVPSTSIMARKWARGTHSAVSCPSQPTHSALRNCADATSSTP